MKFCVAPLIFLLFASAALLDKKVAAASTQSDQKYQQALERYKSLLQAEINTVETQIKVLRNQIQSGKIGPEGPEFLAAKKDLLQLRQRLAAFEAGVIQMPAQSAVTLATKRGKQEAVPAGEAELKVKQARNDYGKLLEEEIELVKLQLHALDKRFQIGTLDINGPEMMSAKRELLELQQRMAIFDAGLLLPTAANQPEK